jgi:hypothetical protein
MTESLPELGCVAVTVDAVSAERARAADLQVSAGETDGHFVVALYNLVLSPLFAAAADRAAEYTVETAPEGPFEGRPVLRADLSAGVARTVDYRPLLASQLSPRDAWPLWREPRVEVEPYAPLHLAGDSDLEDQVVAWLTAQPRRDDVVLAQARRAWTERVADMERYATEQAAEVIEHANTSERRRIEAGLDSLAFWRSYRPGQDVFTEDDRELDDETGRWYLPQTATKANQAFGSVLVACSDVAEREEARTQREDYHHRIGALAREHFDALPERAQLAVLTDMVDESFGYLRAALAELLYPGWEAYSGPLNDVANPKTDEFKALVAAQQDIAARLAWRPDDPDQKPGRGPGRTVVVADFCGRTIVRDIAA